MENGLGKKGAHPHVTPYVGQTKGALCHQFINLLPIDLLKLEQENVLKMCSKYKSVRKASN